MRDHISTEELAAWERLLCANSVLLIVVRAESPETQLDQEEEASKDTHFERWRCFSRERERLRTLHAQAEAARRFLTGDFARELMPPTHEARQMIAVAQDAFNSGTDTTGTPGHSISALSVKALPISRFPRPERPRILEGLTEAEMESVIYESLRVKGVIGAAVTAESRFASPLDCKQRDCDEQLLAAHDRLMTAPHLQCTHLLGHGSCHLCCQDPGALPLRV